jgi:thioredoxin-dependent peroxiredoxin
MTKLFSTNQQWIIISLLTISTFQLFGQNKMKIQASQEAPIFSIKKVMLTFYRNVGCPVCNVRFHELEEQAAFFKSKGMILLAIYESTTDNMKKYLEGEAVFATMIPNPEQNLYELYDIDRSMGKMMKGMFHGAMGKMKKGKKLFKQKIEQDGNSNRIGADFLIDEKGNVQTAYYGKYVGDHLPLNDIKNFLN